MTAIDYLNGFLVLPMSSEKPCAKMSRSELRRHITNGAVLFNDEKVSIEEIIDFPVFSLIFFPNGKRRTTLI